MLVRIRWRKTVVVSAARSQAISLIVASLLAPSAVLAFTITLWGLAIDLRWMSPLLLSGSAFSCWPTWLLASAALFAAAWLLDRFSRSRNPATTTRFSIDC